MGGSVGDRTDRSGRPVPRPPAYGSPMRILRGAVVCAIAVAALALTLASCGDGAGGGATGDEAAVETIFRSYHQALLARDFATACVLNAPETSAELIRNANARGGQATTCEQALTAVYASPGAGAVADGVSNSAEVRDVVVTGDSAVVSWTFDNQGRPEPVDTGVRLIDGQWRLLAVGG